MIENDVAAPGFDDPRLAERMEALPHAVVDTLPYGAIRLRADATVAYYSEAERRLSGSGERRRLGLDFFSKIAPCMDTPAFRGRVERARGRPRKSRIHPCRGF
ncbi:hypothetical protein U1872_01420 [Sphingomonas sp. RB3P16]|uniref:hypothetical protein n=1 Tax=Parasphingomonas frigoris TaxID=3096163 RepID=UPI002FCBE373